MCAGTEGSILHCHDDTAQTYLSLALNVLGHRYNDDGLRHSQLESTRRVMTVVAEGRFLSKQIRSQLGIIVPWAPPLALYVQEKWGGSPAATTNEAPRRALMLRSRFFVSMMGEMTRSLLREIISISEAPLAVTFLGADVQFEEQWLTMQDMSKFSAAILYPNDIHQRTFHEVYRMGVPLFMPDSRGLYRVQRASNWGYSSYSGRLRGVTAGDALDFWWDSFSAGPDVVIPLQQFADWEQFPEVQRFSSLPDLVRQLLEADLESLHRKMLETQAEAEFETLSTLALEVAAAFR